MKYLKFVDSIMSNPSWSSSFPSVQDVCMWHLTCCRIFWKQSTIGTLGIVYMRWRESRHTPAKLCFLPIFAKWIIACNLSFFVLKLRWVYSIPQKMVFSWQRTWRRYMSLLSWVFIKKSLRRVVEGRVIYEKLASRKVIYITQGEKHHLVPPFISSLYVKL